MPSIYLSLDTFELAPYNYKAKDDPHAAELERKGKERMIALQRLRMSQKKVADVPTIDGAVTLCELAL